MITITESAQNKIQEILAEENNPALKVRAFVQGGGCSGFQYGMSFDEPKGDDARFESEGVAFVVDPASLAYLDGSIVDFDDGLQGKGFEIKNPNAESTCGCGKSFN